MVGRYLAACSESHIHLFEVLSAHITKCMSPSTSHHSKDHSMSGYEQTRTGACSPRISTRVGSALLAGVCKSNNTAS